MAHNKIMRILWLSDSPTAQTGFGVVAKNLIKNICAEMGDAIEIHLIGINYVGEPLQYNKQTIIYDGRYDGKGTEGETFDPFCRSTFINTMGFDEMGFDGVFILQDFSIAVPLIEHMKEVRKQRLKGNKKVAKSFLYVPVDSYLHPDFVEGVDFFDCIATYTDYGKREITRHKPELKSKIKVIPHGCNFKDFFPIPKDEIKAFRDEYFGENSGKIIFSNINRNQPRKAIADTIFAFIEAKAKWTLDRKPFLYLHMDRNDPMGQNLEKLLAQTKLIEAKDYGNIIHDGDYMLTSKEYYNEKTFGCGTEILNKIYNASDIYITTTLGEGWGLSVTEAMATRTPVICPYHTSLMHISGKGSRAYTLEELYPTAYQPDSLIRQQTTMYETADVMMEAAMAMLDGSDKKMLDNAESFVKQHDWKTVSKQFLKYFAETF